MVLHNIFLIMRLSERASEIIVETNEKLNPELYRIMSQQQEQIKYLTEKIDELDDLFTDVTDELAYHDEELQRIRGVVRDFIQISQHIKKYF